MFKSINLSRSGKITTFICKENLNKTTNDIKNLMKKIISALLFIASFSASAQVIYPNPVSIKSLKVGDTIPNFALLNTNNQNIESKNLLTNKPIVLIFYRAGWCPFCNTHLSEVQNIEKDILKLGFQIIAISTDKPEKLQETTQKLNLNYTLLSDPECVVAAKFGIAFWAGENWKLPVPSLYVIDKKGIINYNYSNPEYQTRISTTEILKVLKKMN